MSTKTTLKRIALVAVSALGFGLLSSVVPASARTSGIVVSLGTPAAAGASVVGQVTTIATTVNLTTLNATGDTFTVAAVLVAKPASSALDLNGDDITSTGTDVSANLGGVSGNSIDATDDNTDESRSTYEFTEGDTHVAATTTQYTAFTPDVAGTYTLAIFLDGAAGVASTGAIKAGDTVKYISVTAEAAPATTVAIDQPLAGTIATSDTGRTSGGVVRVRVKDAAGNFTRLNSGQQVLLTLPSGMSVTHINGTSGYSTTTTQGLVAGDFNASGVAYVNVAHATEGTYTITGALAGSTATTTLAVTFGTPDTYCAAGSGADNAEGVNGGTDANLAINMGVSGAYYGGTAAADIATTQTSTTITCFGAAASTTAAPLQAMIKITDTDNLIFGLPVTGTDLVQDVLTGNTATSASTSTSSGASGKYPATFVIAHSALSKSGSTKAQRTITVAGQGTSVTTSPALTMAFSGQTASGTATGAFVLANDPTDVYLLVNGGSIALAACYYNQFGAAAPAQATTAIVSAGRNLQATATNLVADADGCVSFTVTDAAPTSATTSDTVTFSNGTYSADVTLNYVAAITASTMTLVPSAVSTTATAPADFGTVYTSSATAAYGADTVSATIKDANGIAIVGAPVTLTVPAGVSLYLSTATAYTDSDGVASWSVYTTKAGIYAFTATAGGLTKTGYAQWTGGTARVVSVTAGTTNGDTTPVTIKVADAYGNGVSSQSVSLKATGGYFQGLPLTSTQSTDVNGEISVAFVGSGTVEATFTGGQVTDAAGYVGTTAATGFPAGVAKASATVTGGTSASASAAEAASDAAAEAIDAANAATDAANLAAEAADAATVAAEEARDAADAATAAVEELATQVATLMAALKAQITTLANTVAKIAKKVKA